MNGFLSSQAQHVLRRSMRSQKQRTSWAGNIFPVGRHLQVLELDYPLNTLLISLSIQNSHSLEAAHTQ
ncbi:hypothetical protein XELAEV_18003233mg [Xenopus laevis]|uniref:Uncharacterized protein n=1 Tax=Xenopus laevis TaxID=8355 RepID=A0A974GY71_XENLA|nr:hypothetical protein XELAEV_18003233mg [Xenopus laevis]